jgi:hypothetical protein|tara:strand:+ start:1700 stop:1861 length:162 start_codon:yes stop_codon:yes gene_type:complete
VTQFEEAVCKVLGVILFLLVVIIGIQLMGCTCSEVPPPIEPEYIDEVDTKHLT